MQGALCSFSIAVVLLFLFESSQASHHVWTPAELQNFAKLGSSSGMENNSHTLSSASASASASAATLAAYRTAFHFQPPKFWMNDPNAPLVYKGYYHLFYQCNNKAPVFGLIHWGHAVSRDLVHWRHLAGAALGPDRWYDAGGAWSGSATFTHAGRAPVIMYTGNDTAAQQVQVLAIPRRPGDPLLREWLKVPRNPVIRARADAGINASQFRDPTTAWRGRDGAWRLLVGSVRLGTATGAALLYRSRDFVRWTLAPRPLHEAPRTGMWECPDFFPVAVHRGLDTSAPAATHHVLKNSLDLFKVDYYTVGTYDTQTDRYVPCKGSVEGPDGLRYDYGKFYASKTFYDSMKRRRVVWGWINESDSTADDLRKGWASLQAIPRVVTLDPLTNRTLIQWPVREIESLRDHAHAVTKRHLVLNPMSLFALHDGFNFNNLGASQMDVEAEFDFTEADAGGWLYQKVRNLRRYTAQKLCFGRGRNATLGGFGIMVLASPDLRERSSVFFKFLQDSSDPTIRKVALCVDQSQSSLKTDVDKSSYGGFVTLAPQQRTVSLRTLVDRSIVESFAERGRTCITSRSYPTVAVAEKARVLVFNHMQQKELGEGSAGGWVTLAMLRAWPMKQASHFYEEEAVIRPFP